MTARGPGQVLGIDVGKTKVDIGLFDRDLRVLNRVRLATGTPEHTIAEIGAAGSNAVAGEAFGAVGLSLFGPLQVNPANPRFGEIVTSSVPAWSGVNLPQRLAEMFRRPLHFDFDVIAGALGELHGLGATKPSFVYASVGSGAGAAVVTEGELQRGLAGGQAGHMLIPREDGDREVSACPFHPDCFQGLASGFALRSRWGVPAVSLPAHHASWDLEARYLASWCLNLVYAFDPEYVLLGGGVPQADGLVERAEGILRDRSGGFPASARALRSQKPILRRATLAPYSSLVGAACLARTGAGHAWPAR